MGRFIARRLVQAVPTLFGILLLTFLLSRLSPADPVKLMVAGNFDITPEDRAVLYHDLGLDDPLPIQFVHFLGDVARLNFGNSFYYHRPVITLSLTGIAAYPRYLRTEVLEIIRQDYVRTAQSKGLRDRSIAVGHVLRNSLIPVVTLLGGILTIILGGSVVIERVFNWPGLGRLLFDGLVNKDYPMVQASVIIGALLLLVSYILRDIAYAWVDPRIKVR